MLVDNKIALLRFFLDVEAVLKSRASARNNADAKSGRFRQIVFAREKFFDLDRRRLGNAKFDIGAATAAI